jgi:hypothetical protein
VRLDVGRIDHLRVHGPTAPGECFKHILPNAASSLDFSNPAGF